MKILLSRIDDRLIHGQITALWAKITECFHIIICDDDVAHDKIRAKMLTQMAPPGVTVHVVGLDKAVRVYENPAYDDERFILLFTNPTSVLYLVEHGVRIRSVNIGGMRFKEGKRQLTEGISVDAKDIEAFKKLHELGIELEVRKVDSDRKRMLMGLLDDKGLLD